MYYNICYILFSGPGTDRAVANVLPKKETSQTKEEPSSLFQRQRVDMLLAELTRKFPIPMYPHPPQNQSGPNIKTENATQDKSEQPVTVKQEPIDSASENLNSIASAENVGNNTNGIDIKPDIKNESMKPPPEKKVRLN